MATNNPVECGVCQEVFNEESRCPRTLPCSHHLCSDCIDQLITKNTKICPFCRKSFEANSSKDVMINHGLRDCAKLMTLQTPKSVKSHPPKSTLYHQRIKEFKEDASKANRDGLNNLQALKKQTEKLMNGVKELRKNFSLESTDLREKILPQIHDIIKKIDKNSETLEPTVRKLEEKLKDIDKKEKLMTFVKEKLEFADSFEGAAALLDEAEETTSAVREWGENLKEYLAGEDGQLQMPRKEANVSKRMKKDLMEALGSKVKDELINPIPAMGAVAEPRNLASQVTAMALWEMQSPVKRLVEQQRLFALKQDGNGRRSAKITIENNKLHLYSLQDELEPDPNVHYLQYEEVIPLSGRPGSMFLDINSKGSTLGRIHIRLNSKAPSCLLLYCTGEKEYSYENNLLKVLDKGGLLGQVLCGGQPSRAHWRQNLNQFSFRKYPCYKWSGISGSVNLLDVQSKPPLFAVRTGPYELDIDDRGRGSKENTIGNVTDGLSMIRDAISCCDNISDITISSCGIVLSTEVPINESSL